MEVGGWGGRGWGWGDRGCQLTEQDCHQKIYLHQCQDEEQKWDGEGGVGGGGFGRVDGPHGGPQSPAYFQAVLHFFLVPSLNISPDQDLCACPAAERRDAAGEVLAQALQRQHG